MGKIISCVNQKGGVGKTTTAINLSTGLAKLGKKVLLIDNDPQTNASTTIIGIESLTNLKNTLYDVYSSVFKDPILRTKLKDVIVPTSEENLYLTPAKIDLSGVEIELASKVGREFVLKRQIDELKSDYDFIIIDSAPNLGILTINAIIASDDIIIPVQLQPYAIMGVNLLLKTIDMIQQDVSASVRVLGLLGTMYDERINVCKEVLQLIRSTYGSKVFNTVIHSNSKIMESSSVSSVLKYEPESRGAKEYMALAEEVLELYGNEERRKSK